MTLPSLRPSPPPPARLVLSSGSELLGPRPTTASLWRAVDVWSPCSFLYLLSHDGCLLLVGGGLSVDTKRQPSWWPTLALAVPTCTTVAPLPVGSPLVWEDAGTHLSHMAGELDRVSRAIGEALATRLPGWLLAQVAAADSCRRRLGALGDEGSDGDLAVLGRG